MTDPDNPRSPRGSRAGTNAGKPPSLEERGSGEAGESTPPSRPALTWRRILLGTLLFVVLSALGVLAVDWITDGEFGPIVRPLATALPVPLAAAVLLGLAEFPLGGTRIWVAARHYDPEFRWWDGLVSHLYNASAGGLTPMRTGGGPAQYYVLRRSGLSGGESVSILTISWVGRMFGFVFFGTLGLFYLVRRGEIPVDGVGSALVVTALVLTVAAVIMILSPGPVSHFLANRPSVRRFSLGRRLIRALESYREAVESFVRHGRLRWLANAACGALILPAQCAAGVAVLMALDIPADHLSALSRQALHFALIYVSPTPGGSGIAEAATLGFMAGLVPVGAMLAFTVLWRVVTGYLPIVVGSVGVVLDLFARTIRKAEAAT